MLLFVNKDRLVVFLVLSSLMDALRLCNRMEQKEQHTKLSCLVVLLAANIGEWTRRTTMVVPRCLCDSSGQKPSCRYIVTSLSVLQNAVHGFHMCLNRNEALKSGVDSHRSDFENFSRGIFILLTSSSCRIPVNPNCILRNTLTTII